MTLTPRCWQHVKFQLTEKFLASSVHTGLEVYGRGEREQHMIPYIVVMTQPAILKYRDTFSPSKNKI